MLFNQVVFMQSAEENRELGCGEKSKCPFSNQGIEQGGCCGPSSFGDVAERLLQQRAQVERSDVWGFHPALLQQFRHGDGLEQRRVKAVHERAALVGFLR
ncbi:MAG: hypothetical protein ACKOJF_19955, partial [Planctomycetaceae bacterium]